MAWPAPGCCRRAADLFSPRQGDPGTHDFPGRRHQEYPRRPEPGAPQRHRLLGLPLRGLRAWDSGLDAAATRRALTHRSGAPRRPLDSSGHGFTVPRASPSRPAGQGPRHRQSFIVLSGFPSTASGPGTLRRTPRPRDRQPHIGAGAPCNSPGTRGRGPASLPSISIFVMNKQGLMRAATYEPPNPSFGRRLRMLAGGAELELGCQVEGRGRSRHP